MKLNACAAVTRRTASLSAAPLLRPELIRRFYATQHGLGTRPSGPTPRRKTVTPFNDDGQVPWSELSAGEKTARATQQSFNFGLIALAAAMTGAVGYFLYTEVFSLDSKVAHFNRAVDRIRKDPRCIELLGDSKKISAHGEETWNKWRRARPIASTISKDAQGNEHLMINFYAEGPLNRGVVYVHMVRTPRSGEFEYKYLYIDVRGHPRIYLENSDVSPSGDRKGFKLFGVNWGQK